MSLFFAGLNCFAGRGFICNRFFLSHFCTINKCKPSIFHYFHDFIYVKKTNNKNRNFIGINLNYIYQNYSCITNSPKTRPHQRKNKHIEKKNMYLVYNHHHHHHHHVVLVARISLTLSHHSSLSFIALGRSSGQHPVSSHSCWMYVRAGRPAFARLCVGVHESTSLMSSSLLLQQCPACLVRLKWIVFLIGGRWPYSWCLEGCCRQDLFKIARSCN